MQENYAGYREWKSWDEAGFGELKPQTKAAFDVEVKRTGLNEIKNVAEVGFGHIVGAAFQARIERCLACFADYRFGFANPAAFADIAAGHGEC